MLNVAAKYLYANGPFVLKNIQFLSAFSCIPYQTLARNELGVHHIREGLIRDAAKSKQKLDIFEYERPIGIQIFGSDIDHMREATEIATLANPDLIDINYGCPVKQVACRGAGASLLQ